ncbi:MAG: hypothetical protein QM729_21255 [Solirubrobacterales bacterium]
MVELQATFTRAEVVEAFNLWVMRNGASFTDCLDAILAARESKVAKAASLLKAADEAEVKR